MVKVIPGGGIPTFCPLPLSRFLSLAHTDRDTEIQESTRPRMQCLVMYSGDFKMYFVSFG